MSRRQLGLVAVAVALIVAAVMAYGGDGRIGDEWVHYEQVRWFAAGKFEVVDGLTTIPAFHLFVAAILRVLGEDTLGCARLVTMAFAILGVLAFVSIRRAVAPGEPADVATLQFVFFPILLPYCFLLYTDVPSLALVLWAVRCTLARRHVLAGVLGIASLLARQTNVVWIAFMALLQALDRRAAEDTASRDPRAGDEAHRRGPLGVARLWPYAVGIAAFTGYWLWRGSVSLAPSEVPAHPDFTLRSGNLYFMLFLVGVFFAPLLPAWLARYAGAVRTRPAWLALPVLLGILYVTTFRVDHPYNLFEPHVYLRNATLLYVMQHRWAFAAFGAVALVAGCAVSQVRWQRPAFVLVLPVSVAFVSVSWLIEQRYYLIPVALLLALRVSEPRRAELAMLVWWIAAASVLLWRVLTRQQFL